MSNWFENSVGVSILRYTIFIIASTWAALYFLVDEEKLNLCESQIKNEQSIVKQLEAKIGNIERRVFELTEENKQLKNWLTNDKQSFPALMLAIEDLENRLNEANRIIQNSKNIDLNVSTINADSYSYSENLVVGQSLVDPRTEARISVIKIERDRSALIYINLPNQTIQPQQNVNAGNHWDFMYQGKNYTLTINQIDWISSSLRATITSI